MATTSFMLSMPQILQDQGVGLAALQTSVLSPDEVHHEVMEDKSHLWKDDQRGGEENSSDRRAAHADPVPVS